jgi:hypothetical protein
LHEQLQSQLDFVLPVVGLVVGTRRGCGGALVTLSCPSGVGAAEYLTTCVLIGVRFDGLLGTTGFGWLAIVIGAGLLFMMVGYTMEGCFGVGAGATSGFRTISGVELGWGVFVS